MVSIIVCSHGVAFNRTSSQLLLRWLCIASPPHLVWGAAGRASRDPQVLLALAKVETVRGPSTDSATKLWENHHIPFAL